MKKLTQKLLSFALAVALAFGLVFIPNPDNSIPPIDNNSIVTNVEDEGNGTCDEINSDPPEFEDFDGELSR